MIAAILGTGLAVGAVNGLVFVYGRVPHPVHRHARNAQHRPRARALGLRRNADLGHAADRADDRRRLDRLDPVLDLRRHRPRARVPRADDPDGLGALAVRGRREPGGGAACEHPDAARARHRLRAERPRRRRRRADHRGPDRRRLAHGGRARRARLDRRRDHRRRRLRGRPRQRWQRARRRASRSA